MSEPVAHASEIAPGTMRRVTAAGCDVLVCNVAGAFYAVEDVCTHDGEPLDGGDLDGDRVICPRHGAAFDVTTGRALTLPAIAPLPTFDVRVDGDDIYVD